MNLKTNYYLYFAFAFVLLATYAEALTCFQGQRLFQDGVEVSDNFISSSCFDPTAICHRYYISASARGTTGKFVFLANALYGHRLMHKKNTKKYRLSCLRIVFFLFTVYR